MLKNKHGHFPTILKKTQSQPIKGSGLGLVCGITKG